jgi:broad specificity phosphatase PhoE
VRHAQASFFADDYDQLSDLGGWQARQLGEYWARRGHAFDEVYTGPRARQRQTAECVGAALAGSSWPAPVELQELDEYDIGGLVHRLVPELAGRDRTFAELIARYRHNADEQSRARAFQKAFEILTEFWMSEAALLDGVESWPAFRDRVRRCVRGLLERPGRGRRVAVFSSGGFIGTAVQMAVAAPDPMALQMSFRIRNCSLTELVFTQGRLTLDGFNALPHLENPELWTYR